MRALQVREGHATPAGKEVSICVRHASIANHEKLALIRPIVRSISSLQ